MSALQQQMHVPNKRKAPSVENRVSPEEWRARIDLAACYRLVADFHWSDLIFTHITTRVPGTHDEFLINPYGMMFDEVTASSLIKVDLDGNKLEDSPYPVNPSGFTIHSAVHRARPDIECVLHTHSLNGGAVSAQKNGFLPISQQSIFVLASLAYHDYDGISLYEEQKPALVKDIGDKHFVMLRNHGLLTLGPTTADAFLMMYIFESACILQLRAQPGGELIYVPQAFIDGAIEEAKKQTLQLGGMMAWPGLLRRLDRMDASYRT